MCLIVLYVPLTGRVRNLCSLGQSVMGHSVEEALCRPVRLRLTESHCTNNPLPFPSPGLTHLTRGPRRTPNWLKIMCRMRNNPSSILNDGGSARPHICLSAWQLVDFELILWVRQTAGSLRDSIGESGLHTLTVKCETFSVLLWVWTQGIITQMLH